MNWRQPRSSIRIMDMRSDRFKRQTLALFFIVSIVPALIVGAVWYVYSQNASANVLLVNLSSLVLPVIMVGVLPAVILSFIFAELLARPVRRIHRATLELARGNFKAQFDTRTENGEFGDIGRVLDVLAAKLQQTLSESASENALIEAERGKLHSVLNSMTDGVFALDRAGRIILFNKAASQLTGRSIEEVAGQLAEKVLPFRAHGELVMTRWLAQQGDQDQALGQWHELELYRADGQSLYVDVQAVVLKNDPNGIATLVTFHDLSGTHQLDQMKIDFVALAAHELRTPLTEIKGYLDILNAEATGLSRANRSFLNRAVASADHLGGLMRNLLNVSRIEHGELGFKLEPINYIEFLTDFTHDMKPRAKQQRRRLELKLPSSLPTVQADASALHEVLINLVDNAFTHTASGIGVITITAEQRGGELETTVTDNGVGIPASALPRLFTKFFRVDPMKSNASGTGLGLYICKSIVEAHGGTIWVESVEGGGSAFTFRLPLGTVAPTPPPSDNETTTTISRGTHGWIKKHPVR
jgi:PAS domain S-box-containing protein